MSVRGQSLCAAGCVPIRTKREMQGQRLQHLVSFNCHLHSRLIIIFFFCKCPPTPAPLLSALCGPKTKSCLSEVMLWWTPMDDEGRLKVSCLYSSGQVLLDRNKNSQHFLFSGKSNGVKRRAIGCIESCRDKIGILSLINSRLGFILWLLVGCFSRTQDDNECWRESSMKTRTKSGPFASEFKHVIHSMHYPY